jgi:tetratricopeptide (TPR) repeat protein
MGASHQFLGNLEAARLSFQECLQLLEEAGDERGIAQALNNLAVVRRDTGDFAEAKQLCEQALAIFGRRKDFAGAAYMQGMLGDLERQLGNPTAAKSWYDQAVEGFQRMGDQPGVTRIMVDVGVLLYERGERREGQAILAQALKSFRDMGNRQGTARALEEFAGIAADKGQVVRAMHLASAAASVRHRWMGRSALKDRPSLLRRLDAVRQTLGPAALDAEMYGWAMTLEAAIEYALNDDATESSQDR